MPSAKCVNSHATSDEEISVFTKPLALASALVASSACLNFVGCAPEEPEGVKVLKGHSQWVNSVAYSRDGNLLVSGGGNYNDDGPDASPGDVKIWDAKTGRLLHTLLDSSGKINSVALAADSKKLASASGVYPGVPNRKVVPGEVRVWDVTSGKELLRLKGHMDLVECVAFLPDGETVASGDFDGAVKLWNAQTGAEVKTLRVNRTGVNAIAVSPDGGTLAIGVGGHRGGGEVQLWDLAKYEKRAALQGHTAGVRTLSFAPDGKTLISGAFDKTVRVWNVANAELRETIAAHDGPVNCVAVSRDGAFFASASGDRTVKLWSLTMCRLVATLRQRAAVHCVSFSPDGETLAIGDAPYKEKGYLSLLTITNYVK
jgi:WD40 repeat protein